MKLNLFKILSLTIFVSHTLIAQTDSCNYSDSLHNSIYHEIGDQIDYGLDDASRFFSRFSETNSTDLIYTAGFIGGLAAAFTLDQEIRDAVSHNQNSTTKSITDFGEKYGNVIFAGTLSLGLFTTGLLTHNREIENTGRVLFEALLIAGGTSQIIKIISGRSRPFTNEGSTTFNFFEFDNPHNSFPSGHTVVAFTTSSVLAASIKNIYASIGLYTLAGLTAYQRIYSDNHWFSDTVLAAGLGTFIGNLLVLVNDERRENTKNKNLGFKFSPIISPSGYGINLAVNF
ncbi:MAG: phosphatase PAP2 family protein [Ignavibacteriales bacterium]|nr:phosphatase PAP2 family protein [Ignavibacteriales bacterium]MBK7378712.1 phosphatase PAP2 family protein [Ignavibacteriales bacterium]